MAFITTKGTMDKSNPVIRKYLAERAEIIRLAIKALELLIAKVLLTAAKVAESIVDVVHEKVVKKDVPIMKNEDNSETKPLGHMQLQLPKKPEEPLLLSKYSMIMELDTELKRRNDEIFKVEKESSNLEIEASECAGAFTQKRRKELQEQISTLDKKAEKMKAELSKVLQNAGYANAAEFYTELFMVREEKQKYEVACKEWQQVCFEVEFETKKDTVYCKDVKQIKKGRLQ